VRLVHVQDRFVNLANLAGAEFVSAKERKARQHTKNYREKELGPMLHLWWDNDNEMCFYGQEALWLYSVMVGEAELHWDRATMAIPEEVPDA
jgi:hypothetical protein